MLQATPKGMRFQPADRRLLGNIARRIVMESHGKTTPIQGHYRETPIGRGGKIDDTSCVIAQVVEWTDAHGDAWAKIRSQQKWTNLLTCGGEMHACEREREYVSDDDASDSDGGSRLRNYPAKPN